MYYYLMLLKFELDVDSVMIVFCGLIPAVVLMTVFVGNRSFAAWLTYFSFDGEIGILLLPPTPEEDRLDEDFDRLLDVKGVVSCEDSVVFGGMGEEDVDDDVLLLANTEFVADSTRGRAFG